MKTKTIAMIVSIFYAAALVVCVVALYDAPSAESVEASAQNHAYETEYAWFFKPAEGGEQPGFDPMADLLPKYDGYCIGSPDVKAIYLTFDSGYENGSMPGILDTLKEKGVSAAFFITGHYARSNPDLIKRMQNEGHLVCNHTDKHKNGAKIASLEEFRAELTGVEEACAKEGVNVSKFYRPSEGVFCERTLDYAKQCGYKTIFWSFAYVDWKQDDQPGEDYAIKNFMARIHPGAIVLLHSTSTTNEAILGELIDRCKEEGYEFRTLNELV